MDRSDRSGVHLTQERSWTLQSFVRSPTGAIDGQAIAVHPGQRLVVGRSSRADVLRRDPRLSGQHFSLSCHQDRASVIVTDLSSTNGTEVGRFPLHDAATLVEEPTVVCAGRSLFILTPPTQPFASCLAPILRATPDEAVPFGREAGRDGRQTFGPGDGAKRVVVASPSLRDQLGQSVLFALIVRASAWAVAGDVRLYVASESPVITRSLQLPLVEVRADDAPAVRRLEDALMEITSRRTEADHRVLMCVGAPGSSRRTVELARQFMSIGGSVVWISANRDVPAADEQMVHQTFGPAVGLRAEQVPVLGAHHFQARSFAVLAAMLRPDRD